MALARTLSSRVAGMTRNAKVVLLLVVDSLLIPLSFWAALTLGPIDQIAPGAMMPELLALILVGIAASCLLGVSSIRLRDFEADAVLRSGGHTVVLVLAAALLLGGKASPGTFAVFGMAFFLASILSRLAMREALVALYRAGREITPVIIYGAGTTGMQLTVALNRGDSVRPVALVDDNTALHGLTMAGLRVHSPLALPVLAARYDARRVILAMPSLPAPKRAEIARRLVAAGLEVQALPSFSQLVGEQLPVDRIAPLEARDFLHREQLNYDGERLAETYRGRSVLVSGAGGSIGSELCRQVLACRPGRLILFELSEFALFQVERELRGFLDDGETEIVPVLGSVTDPRLVRSVIREHGVEIVLHAAAYKHVPLVERNVVSGLANNVLGTHTLARAAVAAGVERFILISSDKAVRPTSVMGATKRLAELIVQDLAVRATATRFAAVRFGNVLGSSGSVVPVFREQIAAGGPITLTDADATRYFMTVEEAVHLVLVAGAYAAGGEIFVLDMGEPVRIADLARKMIAAAGYKVRDEKNPQGDIEIRLIGLRDGERVHEERMSDGARPSGAHPSILTVAPPRLSEIELAAIVRAARSAVTNGGSAEAQGIIERFVHDYRRGRAAEPSSAAS